MSKTTLIILDLQNCFITDKTKSLPQKIKNHIESQKYDFIVFSKFINSESSNFVKKLNWNKCKNSPEIDIVPELSEISLKNYIFEKNAYSIFKSKEFAVKASETQDSAKSGTKNLKSSFPLRFPPSLKSFGRAGKARRAEGGCGGIPPASYMQYYSFRPDKFFI